MRATKCLGSLAMTALRPSNHCPGDDVTLSTYAKIRTTICREWLGACARVKRRRGRRGSGESEGGPDRAGIGGMGTTTGTAPFVGERQRSLYAGRRHPTRKDYRIVNVNGPPMGRLCCFTARHRVYGGPWPQTVQ